MKKMPDWRNWETAEGNNLEKTIRWAENMNASIGLHKTLKYLEIDKPFLQAIYRSLKAYNDL